MNKSTEENLLDKYNQLQTSYYQLEDDKLALENQLKKIKRRRKFIIIILLAIGLAGSGYFWFEEGAEWTTYLNFWKTQEEQLESTDNHMLVKKQLLQIKLPLTGKIEPLDQMEIISPLKGMVKEKNFQYNEFVKQGQVLLVIDTNQEQANYRKAYADYLNSKAEVKKIRNWKDSSEVARARRGLTKVQYNLNTTQRELEEIKRLLKKGIVAASELENKEKEYRNQKLDYQSSQDELDSVLEQGSKEKLQIVELKQKNSKFEMETIETRIKNARVVSPIDGVVLLPINTKDDIPSRIQRGSFVKQEQVLFTIANLQGFTIKTKVDEIDILKLKIGQKVTITGDAFKDITLEGTIKYIASQADTENAQKGMPSNFTVTIAVSKLTKEHKQRLLLGMSTDMEVLLEEKPNALVVPFEAVIIDEEQQAWVIKLDAGKSQKVKVKTGMTTIDMVEILEGVQFGEKLLPELLPEDE